MKFYSKPLEEHAEVPLADDGRWEALVAHWTRREAPQRGAPPSGNACFVVSVHRHGDRGDPFAQLARRRLEQIKHADAQRRRQRTRAFRVALAGYTNAGKTSIMNALCDAGLPARDRPFETLDATTRCLTRHGGDVLLSDTVGFIRRLPERLFASFESTLAEISEASLLVVVVDVSDPELEEHLRLIETVLARLGAGLIPRLVVFNKSDRPGAAASAEKLAWLAGSRGYLCVSAHDRATMDSLREAILLAARARHAVRELFVPYERGELSGRIYAQCRVLRAHATARGTQFLIEGAPMIVEQLARACRRRTP